MNKFYITTSIAYTNADPHLGYALESVQTDVLARYHRILGEDVFFLTGTDEHGQKIMKASQAEGKDPRKFVDGISQKFKDLGGVLGLSNDDFIRTSDKERHWPAVHKVWNKLKDKGDIYKKEYEGLYCIGCEAFITKKDLKDGKCTIHGKEPEKIKEENYFFKLSKYSKKIEETIKTEKIRIIPDGRKNETLGFIKQGLEDISFSRPSKDLSWGVPVPDDGSQTIYVWADALTNYLSAIDYEKESDKFKYWPADIHCIGKDIQKFHCLIWIGMLLSLGLPLPKKIFVHGFITVAGQKMSKSLGNIINPFELVAKYGKDPVRYFLLREFSPTEDGDFTYERFEQRYNSDLAKGLGNLVARTIALAGKEKINISNCQKLKNLELNKEIDKIKNEHTKALQECRFNESLSLIWNLIGFCDRYIEKEKPWEKEGNKEVISNLMMTIKEIAEMIKPFLPDTSENIFNQLKEGSGGPLFPRLD